MSVYKAKRVGEYTFLSVYKRFIANGYARGYIVIKPGMNCIHCSEECKGRSDKKFCSDDCRSAYHNKQRTQISDYGKNILRQLKINRSVLLNMSKKSQYSLDMVSLHRMGFNEEYFTSKYKQDSSEVYECIDISYIQNHDSITILKYYL